MEKIIDYSRELRKILILGPCCPFELAEQISEQYDLELEDVKLHVLLELRNMISLGEVEIMKMDPHERYLVQYFPD